MNGLLETRISHRLRGLKNAGQFRKLAVPAGVDLSSNDYLGLASHPLLKERMAAAVWSEGCGSTGSRLLRGQREGFARVERRFADFKRTEAALYFGSGYMANLAVLSTFLEREDHAFSDSLNHASLIDGMRLGKAGRTIFPHGDTLALTRELGANRGGAQFVVTESIFSMDGDFAPLRDYAALAKQTGAALIIDEAHAAGIYGERGSGLVEAAGISDAVFLSVNPMGKAFGVAGAFVCGPGEAIEYLIQRARPFVFSTAPPPPVAAALEAALDLVEQQPERRARVLALARFLRGLLADRGFAVAREGSQIIPIGIGDNQRAVEAAAMLQEAGFDVRAIRPPTVPEGTARLRISVNAGLDEETLRKFACALAAILERPAA
jgi:8-amino-7-oxononanoate synthase